MTYYGRWTYKFEEAARQGAAAAFIVHDTAPASYGWNVVDNSWSGSQLYMQSANNGADQTAVNGWLTNDAAHRLFAAAGQDLDALTRAAQQRGFHAVPLGLRASIAHRQPDPPHRVAQRDRHIAGAHPSRRICDLHRPLGPSRHLPHRGARTGSATARSTMPAARPPWSRSPRRMSAPARRTARIIFLNVTGEESGLLGSAYYAAHPIYPLARTAGGFNMDWLNLAGAARDFVSIGGGKSELDAFLARAARGAGPPGLARADSGGRLLFPLRPVQLRQAGRADALRARRRGSGPWRPAAGRAAADDYRAHRYHQVSDEYDPHWDWSGAVADVGVYYRVGRELANSRAWPNWLPGDEFRAIRDRSRAAA